MVVVVVGEAQQSESARCDIVCIAAPEVELTGKAMASDDNSQERPEKARDGASAYTEVEEKEIDKKAGSAYCRADLGMP